MPIKSTPNGFLPNETNPQKLLFYPKLVAIYDVTFQFINRYLDVKDRTRDQMLQAARSGKQNIIEGAADGLTSSKMELSLTNCAKAACASCRPTTRTTCGPGDWPSGRRTTRARHVSPPSAKG